MNRDRQQMMRGEKSLDGDNHGDRAFSKRNFIARLLFGRPRVRSEEELQQMIHASEEEGIINEEEGEMFHSIFEFGDTLAREIMVPRTDMVCCSSEASVAEILRTVITSGHSRLPVYEGTTDRIIGLIYAKDLLKFWGVAEDQIAIRSVMRTPFFVPESKKIGELLKEFRSRRMHMAIVIDEYGGTSGLVTIEDLLEEIVGDIQDEYDLEDDWLVTEDGGATLVDCRLNIEEFAAHFRLSIPRDKFDTVGGWLVDLLGRVPLPGEKLTAGSLVVSVLEGDERSPRKIRVHCLPPAEKAEPVC